VGALRNVPAWFERTFNGGFPVSLMPNLLTRLRGTPARLEEVLSSRSHEVLTARTEGKWSAQEQAGHLLILESLWLTRLEDFASRSEHLTLADLQNRRTFEADFNGQELTGVFVAFRAARGRLLARIGELDAGVFDYTLLHPRLKTPMSLGDLLLFVAEHDDHHLAMIWELLEG